MGWMVAETNELIPLGAFIEKESTLALLARGRALGRKAKMTK